MCEELVRQESRLERVAARTEAVDDPGELLQLAEVGSMTRRFELAMDLYRRAFEEEPAFAENLEAEHRLKAARAGVAAAGAESGPVAESRSPRHALQALGWLKQDLAARQTARNRGTPRHELRAWSKLLLSDPAFSTVRDPCRAGAAPSGSDGRVDRVLERRPRGCKVIRDRTVPERPSANGCPRCQGCCSPCLESG